MENEWGNRIYILIKTLKLELVQIRKTMAPFLLVYSSNILVYIFSPFFTLWWMEVEGGMVFTKIYFDEFSLSFDNIIILENKYLISSF